MKHFLSTNNVLTSIFALELLALTFKNTPDVVWILLLAQIIIFVIKIRSDLHVYRRDTQLQLPHLEIQQVLVHTFNHYILPLTQIITVNLFFLTYESYLTYLMQIALNIVFLAVIFKNIDAWFKNKYIIEAQTQYIYDIVSTFILFNAFWGFSIYLTSNLGEIPALIILFILYALSLALTLLRYHLENPSKISLIFIAINLGFFLGAAYLFTTSLKFVAAVSFGYYISLSMLHHFLSKDFKWSLALEYAILTGIILLLLY
jgi:hypothetical protein